MDVADSSDVSGLTRMHLICELVLVKRDKKLSQLYLQKPNAILNANGSLPTCLLVFDNPCLMWVSKTLGTRVFADVEFAAEADWHRIC